MFLVVPGTLAQTPGLSPKHLAQVGVRVRVPQLEGQQAITIPGEICTSIPRINIGRLHIMGGLSMHAQALLLSIWLCCHVQPISSLHKSKHLGYRFARLRPTDPPAIKSDEVLDGEEAAKRLFHFRPLGRNLTTSPHSLQV
jgi:hypothetical protein